MKRSIVAASLRSGYAGPICGVLTALGGIANAVVWQVAGEQQGTLPAACVTGFGAPQRTPRCLSASILRRVHDANRADACPAFAELTGCSLNVRRCRREGIQHARQLLVGVLQAVTAHRRCPAVRRRRHAFGRSILLDLRPK